jgi:hypothetical protein
MAERDGSMAHPVTAEDLDALNALVRDGLIDVVSIDEHGTPS